MNSVTSLKDILQANNDELQQQFDSGVDIYDVLKFRSQTIDGLLREMWLKHDLDAVMKASLVAVGGYGREEMHPASDVDLLILLETEPTVEAETKLSDFVTQLWDLGLEIGHSVRTLDECVTEAKDDLTVITNLIEARYLCGDESLFSRLKASISPDKIWTSVAFFNAKIEEQNQRYERYGDTAYRVEPNLKDGPGGLRDLQMIGWIVLREYGIGSLKTLSEAQDNDLLNAEEYHDLIEARDFLWKVRFVLHQLTGRKEDRLLFDHQRHLAHSFGFTNDEKNQSIEAFMQRYYRTITVLERLNEILLGLLRKHILKAEHVQSVAINNFYVNEGGYLELARKDLFKNRPATMLEVFHVLQIRPELKGLTPQTIRELRRNLDLIDSDFREDWHNKHMFISIISEPERVNFVLRRMNRYGVLAAYIPAFANIVGRMQYDLFHAYTVDDHTLNVVRNIRRLSTPQGAADNPFCSELFNKMSKPMILVLAGIFHDIAKGRGGSHSELGAVDALEFCRSHDLLEEDAQMVRWLVEQHLLFSGTAQRKDINDPDVIKEFASIVNTQPKLDYLYILTICDIKGTNLTLLTSWKHSLLKELYRHTQRYLTHNTKDKTTETIQDPLNSKKHAVLAKLNEEGIDKRNCERFWQRFGDDYFQQYSKERLYWHISEISDDQEASYIVRVADSHKKDGTVLLIYAQDHQGLFVKITSVIEQQRLDTVGASITSTDDGYGLLTFYLLNHEGVPLQDEFHKKQLLESVEKSLKQSELSYNFDYLRVPRQLKHFDTDTIVKFGQNEKSQRTVITIRTVDGVGLLTRIGEVFNQERLTIHAARITTLGEIAEDIFEVTSHSGKMISDELRLNEIEEALKQKLDS